MLTLQELLHGCDFLLSSDERSKLDWQVVRAAIKGLERWEIGRQVCDDQLVQAAWTL
jgi:hypothetical protein